MLCWPRWKIKRASVIHDLDARFYEYGMENSSSYGPVLKLQLNFNDNQRIGGVDAEHRHRRKAGAGTGI